jgi:glycosyltransferase involved in cell wall biosynthesis
MKILVGPGMVPVKEGGKFAGGAAFVAYNIAKELAKKGNKVYVYPLHENSLLVQGQLTFLKKKKIVFLISNFFKILNTALKKRKKFSKYYDKPSIRKIFRLSGIYIYWKLAIRKIKPDLISLHGNSIDNLPALEAAKEGKVNILFTSHGITAHDDSLKLNYNKTSFEQDFFNELRKLNVRIVAVSSSVKKKICNFYDYPRDQIKIILNGVSADFFKEYEKKEETRNKYCLPQNSIQLITVGSLTKRKNHDLVLRTLQKLNKRFVYIIVGDGPEEQNLKSLSKKLGVQNRVFFIGKHYGSDLVNIYNSSDLFILTSKSEGLPLVYLEALAAGLPIVTMKNLEGVSDIYKSDIVFLANEYKVNELAEKINEAIKNSTKRKNIKDYARSFNWKNIGNEYEKIIKEL